MIWFERRPFHLIYCKRKHMDSALSCHCCSDPTEEILIIFKWLWAARSNVPVLIVSRDSSHYISFIFNADGELQIIQPQQYQIVHGMALLSYSCNIAVCSIYIMHSMVIFFACFGLIKALSDILQSSAGCKILQSRMQNINIATFQRHFFLFHHRLFWCKQGSQIRNPVLKF